MVRADWVKPGAIVVDVGINVVQPPSSLLPNTRPDLDAASVQWAPGTYRVVGDIAFEEVSQASLTSVDGLPLHCHLSPSKYALK